MSLDEAAFKGIYRPELINTKEKYLDSSIEYHWEKEFIIQAYELGEIPVYIYQRLNESDTLFKINSLTLIVKNIPKPAIENIKEFNDILNTNQLKANYDADFLEGKNYFSVNNYTFSAFNKRGKLLFSQECYGADFTLEIIKCVSNPEVESVRFEQIVSKGFKFEDIYLTRK